MLDLSRDYLLIDDPISITYSVKTAESVWADPVTIAFVQRQALTSLDFQKNPAMLQKVAAVFQLWKANLLGITPKIGDKLGDGQNWVVETVEYCDRDANGVQRFRLTCIRSNR